MRLHMLLAALLWVLLARVGSAQAASNDSSADGWPVKLTDDAEAVVPYIGYNSSAAPLRSVLFDTANASLRDSYNRMLRFAEFIEEATVGAAEEEAGLDEDEKIETLDDRLKVCNSNKDDWFDDLPVYIAIRGWPEVDTDCVTNVLTTDDATVVNVVKSEYDAPSREDVFNWVVRHGGYVNASASEAARAVAGTPRDEWEEEWYRGQEFGSGTRNQECDMDYMGFVKRDGVWYVAERITNRKRRTVAQSLQRLYLYEYIGRNGTIPMYLKNNATGQFVPDATTAIFLSEGSEKPSAFSTFTAAENIAVNDALKRGDHRVQQADDATTPSNIAILALPLVMNLVPVALIAEVNTVGMLVYTLLTDILTAVPLAIKGVEVLQIGLYPTFATVSRISGATLGMQQNGSYVDKAMELWVAKCHARESLRVTGIILLTIAITAMVGGIAAEFLASKWASRRGAGMVVDDPWSGADVPLIDVVANEPEPVSSTTTVPHSLGGTSSALMLASAAALRERESAAAAAAAATSQQPPGSGAGGAADGYGSGGTAGDTARPANSGSASGSAPSAGKDPAPAANAQLRDRPDTPGAINQRPARPSSRPAPEQGRAKQA